MIRFFKKIYKRESFQPSFLGLFVNPFYFSRKELYKHIKKLAPKLTGKTLDIGCGQMPYKYLFCNVYKYIGLEIDSPNNRKEKNADLYYDGKVLPFSDNSFDSIFMSQVLEHIFHPDSFVVEVARIIKDDGILLISVPFAWDEHEKPVDYARYSSYGIRDLLERNFFCIVEQYKTATDIRAVFQLFNAYIYKITVSNNKWLNLFTMVILIAPINICGVIFSKIFPQNPDFYLDNIIVARKISNNADIK